MKTKGLQPEYIVDSKCCIYNLSHTEPLIYHKPDMLLQFSFLPNMLYHFENTQKAKDCDLMFPEAGVLGSKMGSFD